MKCCRDSGSIFYGVQRDLAVLGSYGTFGPDMPKADIHEGEEDEDEE